MVEGNFHSSVRLNWKEAPKFSKPVFFPEMERNDEMTAPGLSQSFHEQKWRGCNESSDGSKLPPSIVRWSGSQTAQKGSSFAKDVCWKTSSFDNVIFTDECSIHMENHGKLSFHRKWEPPKLKGRPKHPFKVHVGAGIFKRGSTSLWPKSLQKACCRLSRKHFPMDTGFSKTTIQNTRVDSPVNTWRTVESFGGRLHLRAQT